MAKRTMKHAKRSSRKMGGKKGKKGARKTHRKRGGGFFTQAPPLEWNRKFTADRINEVGLKGYSMVNDPTANTITVDFNGMGTGVKMAGSSIVFKKIKELVLKNFYPGQSVLPNTVSPFLEALKTTSVVVFQGPVDLMSCTVDGTELDLTGAAKAGGFNKLKTEYDILNEQKLLKNVKYIDQEQQYTNQEQQDTNQEEQYTNQQELYTN